MLHNPEQGLIPSNPLLKLSPQNVEDLVLEVEFFGVSSTINAAGFDGRSDQDSKER